MLVYMIYTGTRDTTPRFKRLLESAGFKTAVLRARVDASRREDWIFAQEDRGIELLVHHPDLVRTGLDLLSWPTMVFLQSGRSVYTLQPAVRRSWRIRQKAPVDVHFLGYGDTAQIECLRLFRLR